MQIPLVDLGTQYQAIKYEIITFIATFEAIALVGATPVFVDVEPLNSTLDWRQLDPVFTSRTRAIIPVYLYGHPVAISILLYLLILYQFIGNLSTSIQPHGFKSHVQAGRQTRSTKQSACTCP